MINNESQHLGSMGVSVFTFTDYRLFIKEMFSQIRQKNPNISYRVFNRKAGIQSSGFLKLVMDGKRNLAKDGIGKIAKGFSLNERETQFFENLVYFNQAKNHEEKDHYFKELSKERKFRLAKPLAMSQYNLFSHWYCVAILELVRLDAAQTKDIHWLIKNIHPYVGLKKIKKAVKELKKIKLLGEDSKGNLIRFESMLRTPDEVTSIAVESFHLQMSDLAKLSVERDHPQDREFSALTAAMSENALKKAKKEIQEFRKKIHSLIEEDEDSPKRVVGHINFQLFKLSKLDVPSS